MDSKNKQPGKIKSKMFKTIDDLYSDVKSINSINKAEKFKDQIWDSYWHGEKKAISTGLPQLDPHLNWQPGYVYCFTAYPATGKSEFVNYLSVLRAKKGWKIAMYSPENYPIKNLVINLMRAYLGNNVTKGYHNICTEKELTEALDFVNKQYFFIDYDDIPTLSDLLYQYGLLLADEGVKMFITDPFNALAEGIMGDGNISKYLKVGLTQMKIFAQQNEIINCIVEHPSKPQIDRSGNIPEVTPWMLYGGSMWWNKMDVIVALTRDLPNGINTKVVIWKVKNQRVNGKPGDITLGYEIASGRFTEPKISLDAPY